MNFPSLTEQFTDSTFKTLGLQVWIAQYRGLTIPSETIFDNGAELQHEANLPIIEGQHLHVWTALMDKLALGNALAQKISDLVADVYRDCYQDNLITVEQYQAQVDEIHKAWASEVVISANQAWHLSHDGGKTWRNVKTFSTPHEDNARYRITFVSLGD
ncbi:hypothetical protein V2H45_17255 [Tumidithrix elongata RA019]|uniref:Uncharacterized protein n=1 Tax=Tumidithrix elongata BACA0141 TaxID=2716417 RepID=A0AAW9Q793_9CYAN|nr:hypothetical protein [Tumidithrix elongata RA019]